MDVQHTMLLRKAEAALAAERCFDARQLCTRVLASRKHDPAALYTLARTAWKEAEHDEAIDHLKRLVAKQSKNTQARCLLGRYLNEQGRYREAVTQFERVLKLDRNNEAAVAGLADALELRGDSDRALTRLTPYLNKRSESPEMARVAARIALQQQDHDEVIRLTERHVGNGADPFYASQLLFLAARALETQQRFDEAFERYQQANELRPGAYDPKRDAELIDETIDAYSPSAMASLPRATTDSARCIFIISRPRSGGTLVERILSAHPQVHAAGEIPALVKITASMSFNIASHSPYPACIRDLDQDDVNRLSSEYLDKINALNRRAFRITDKHLYTWAHVGLIDLLFPQASIIDLRRDAVDNCLACYTAPLGERYPFSSDLEHLGLAHRQYERLMDHWHSLLPGRIFKLRYEDLVSDPEPWSRRLVEHCGLEWDDACLSHHEQRTGTAAPTLSNAQVRQPVYTSSVGRAEKFAAHLEPLRAALASS